MKQIKVLQHPWFQLQICFVFACLSPLMLPSSPLCKKIKWGFNTFLKCFPPHDYYFTQRASNPTIFNILWFFFPTSICFMIMIWKTSNIDNMCLNKSFESQQAHIRSLFPPTQPYILTHSLTHLWFPCFPPSPPLQSNKLNCISSHRKHTQSTKHSCSSQWPMLTNYSGLQLEHCGYRWVFGIQKSLMLTPPPPTPTLSPSAPSASANPFT